MRSRLHAGRGWRVTGGGSTTGPAFTSLGHGVPSIDQNVGQDYPTFPDPCELDLSFGSVPVDGGNSEAEIKIDNLGQGTLNLAIGASTIDQFSLMVRGAEQVPPAGALPIIIDYASVTRGPASSTFVIQTDGVNPACPTTPGQGTSLTLKLSGTGTQAGILTVNPTTLDFGKQLAGTTESMSVMLTNTSTAEVGPVSCTILSNYSPSFFAVANCPTFASRRRDGTCGHQLRRAGGRWRIAVGQRKNSGKRGGRRGGQASILQGEPVERTAADVHCGNGSVDGFTFSGNGSVGGGQPNFGYAAPGTTFVECLPVGNDGDMTYTVRQADLDFQDAGAFALSATDDAMPPNPIAYPLSIPPGGNAEICYSFAPSIAAHQYDGQVTLSTTDTSWEVLTFELLGWGGGPQITCTPASVDFGPSPINDILSIPVTCNNTGTALPGVTLTIGGSTITGSGAFSYNFDPTTNPYPAVGLEPGQKAQIDVIYLPTARSRPTPERS